MKPRLSVVVPCYNESLNLPELVARIDNVFNQKQIYGELVLVNDGSFDNTGHVIEKLAQEYTTVVPVHHDCNKGIADAWRSGVSLAKGTYVCLIDADLQYLPEDIWRLYREITNTSFDMVQGYRSSVGREKDSRYYISRGLNGILNVLFEMHLTDNKSGFVIARKETLEDVLRHRYRYHYFQTFITVSATVRGYSIREIETLFENRRVGQSFMSAFPLLVIMRVFADLVKAFFEFRIFPKRDDLVAEFLSRNPRIRRDRQLSGWERVWFEFFILTTPLHKWMITRRARLYYDELKESQWLAPEKMKELQELKLRRLIQHAYQHVGYWRQVLDEAGIDPHAIRTIEDLSRLPLLSKDDVRKNLYFDMLSDNHDKSKVLKVSTSGSTGEPFICYADQHQLEIRWASTLRSLEWTGYKFGDRCARLWHQTLGMTFTQVFRERLDAWFNRRLFVPAFELSDTNLELFVHRLRQYSPVLIDGYAESLNFLAHYIRNHGIEGLHLKAIVSSAQYLPEQSRSIIEETFGCKVFDKYGSREFSGIAYECEAHDGHHVIAESYIVEILKEGRPASPGEMGEVVITDLNNYCMPLIRYRVGDLALAMDNSQACACTRGLPRIGKVEGRVQSIIFGTNGTYMPGTFFAHLFKDYDHVVRQYQVVQERPESITLKIVKAGRFNDQSFAEILATLHKFLGQDMVIDVEFTDKIPMVRTGKHAGVVSKLPIDFQKLEPAASASGQPPP